MIAHTQNISKTKTRVLITFSIFATGALFLVLFLHFRGASGSSVVVPGYADAIVHIGETAIPVSVADTPVEQEQGLSDTPSLPETAGMLFLFDEPGSYGFWMKDMHYPLDLIWVGEDMRIVSISRSVPPESYPQVFYPSVPARYVLEVNGGFSVAHSIAENDLLTIGANLSF